MGVSPASSSSASLGGFAYDPNAQQTQGQQQSGSGYQYGNTNYFNPAAGIMANSQTMQAQAAPPKKESHGFFSKLGAVVKGVTDIPGKIVGGVVNTVTSFAKDPIGFLKDPKNLLMVAGTIACFIPGLNAVAIPAMAAYGIYKGGEMAVKGGIQAYQGWKSDDLGMIEDGVANAGTGAVIAGASVVGARANIKANIAEGSAAAKAAGITEVKGTGFMQSQKLAWQNTKMLAGDVKSAWAGGTDGVVQSRLLGADADVAAAGGSTDISVSSGGLRGVRDLGKGYYSAETANPLNLKNGVEATRAKVGQIRENGIGNTVQGVKDGLTARFSAGGTQLRTTSTSQLASRMNEISALKAPTNGVLGEYYAIESELARRGASISGENGSLTVAGGTGAKGLTSNLRNTAGELGQQAAARGNQFADWLSRNDIFHIGEARVAASGAEVGGLPGLPRNFGGLADKANGFNAFNVGANGVPVIGNIANNQVNPFEQMQQRMIAQLQAAGYQV